MAKSSDKDLLQLDLYEILDVSSEASEKEIKQSFRKKALICHPDKNPDNPNAAEEFNRLKKILEILLDPGARGAYDKVLKGRKAAALRARENNLKSQKFKDELDRREKLSFQKPQLSEEERFKREVKRLEEEGEKLIQEELELLNKEALAQMTSIHEATHSRSDSPTTCRVKARWKTSDGCKCYTKEDIMRLFYKWGEINAVVIKEKTDKSTALIEFKTEDAANMAIQFEKGMPENPIEVTNCTSSLNSSKKKKKKKHKEKESERNHSRDFESIPDMNRRRAAERQRLIEKMLLDEST